MSLGRLTSSALLYCPDEPTLPPVTGAVTETATVTATVTFTKTWEYAAWAACPTAEWPALYTIVEVCTGDPDVWTQPTIPPNFIKTVVTCGVCEQKTQTITCPVEEAAQTGDVTIYGNGVTATPASVPAMATDAPGSGMGPGAAPGAAPGSGPGSAPGSMPGSMPGTGSAPGAGSAPGSGSPAPGAAPGAAPGSSPNMGMGGDSPAGAPLPAPNNNNGNAAPGSSPDSGSGSSPAPGSGPGSGPGAAPAPGGGEAGGMSPTMVEPQSNAGTDGASSPYATAGAPTLKSTLLLVSGIFALVSGSLVCY